MEPVGTFYQIVLGGVGRQIGNGQSSGNVNFGVETARWTRPTTASAISVKCFHNGASRDFLPNRTWRCRTANRQRPIVRKCQFWGRNREMDSSHYRKCDFGKMFSQWSQ